MSALQGKELEHTPTYRNLVNVLEKNAFRNTVFLKILKQYKDTIQIHRVSEETESDTLLHIATADSSFYSHLYPETKAVYFVIHHDGETMPELLQTIEKNLPALVCVSDTAVVPLLSEQFELDFARSYISFTVDAVPEHNDTAEVTVETELTSDCAEFFKRNGYSDQELSLFFSWGSKSFCIRSQEGKLLSACFIFPNYQHENTVIWEIAGLHTNPIARGQGLAKQIVRASAEYILSTLGGQIRYQVENNNTPSIQLAKSLGFTEFLRLEHYLVTPKHEE